CVAFDHHNLPCGIPQDHTHPLSLVDRALIMGLAILFQRESSHSWSITHCPTKAFADCFPIQPLPSPADADAFLKAVQEQVQQGVARFTEQKPDETAVAKRVHPPLEGLMGWHDLWSEDGSFNSAAHSSIEHGSDEEKTHITKSYKPSEETEVPPSSSKRPAQSKELPDPLPLSSKAPNDGVRKISNSVHQYRQVHNTQHAASARSRNHRYWGTILIPDSDNEGNGEGDAGPAEPLNLVLNETVQYVTELKKN
ncbi:hypothetical protein BT96DRAFT_950689, partial [Gymnopus androsaceus JB14]